jgi:hypothetical protein
MRLLGANKGRPVVCACLVVVLATPAAAESEYVEAIQAQTEIPENQLLDVGIEIFDPGLPEDDVHALEEKGVFPDVRNSEARFIPLHLKNTLEGTANWGAVRVIPKGADDIDVKVSGRIVESTGMNLVVTIVARDSRGNVWRDKRYKGKADPRVYFDEDGSYEIGDPFQELYNEIANDLLESRGKLDDKELVAIREISGLRFAADLVPSAYDDYLKTNKKGRISIRKLPSLDDPMITRVSRVRERDYMFIDTLNEHYADFYVRMGGPYDSWRHYSYEEQYALQQIRKAARTRMILGALMVVGGLAVGGDMGDLGALGGGFIFAKGMDKAKEQKIHRDAMAELAASFDAEIAPVLVDVDGQTLRLQGSAETQFAEWRRLLGEIFATETGLPVDPNVDGSAGSGATANP